MQGEPDDTSSQLPLLTNQLLDPLLYKGACLAMRSPRTSPRSMYSTASIPRATVLPSTSLHRRDYRSLCRNMRRAKRLKLGKEYTSGAIYSPVAKERSQAWQNKCLYYECSHCHFAKKVEFNEGTRGETLDCPACSNKSFGPAKVWLRPPGFAHPVYLDENTEAEDAPTRSYATRANLMPLHLPIKPHGRT